LAFKNAISHGQLDNRKKFRSLSGMDGSDVWLEGAGDGHQFLCLSIDGHHNIHAREPHSLGQSDLS
jgi:hypothetical protein